MSICLLIKPSSSNCNMKCNYCFYDAICKNRQEYSKGFMNIKTMKNIIKETFREEKRHISFVFQGGEPLLSKIEFFNNFINLCNEIKENQTIDYCIQTNGILINEEWCEFFKKNNILIGISFDVIQEIHNKNRGNYDTILTSIKLLQKNNIEFNVLSVLTNDLAKEPIKLFSELKRLEIKYYQFIPIIVEEYNKQKHKDLILKKGIFAEFLCKMFKLYIESIKDGNYISIRFFDNIINILNGYRIEQCGLSGKCSPNLVIEGDGSVYPCDFYCFDNCYLGNINNDSLLDLINSPIEKNFLKNTVHLKCINCKYRLLCNNGCKKERINNLNIYCEDYKIFYNFVFDNYVIN